MRSGSDVQDRRGKLEEEVAGFRFLGDVAALAFEVVFLEEGDDGHALGQGVVAHGFVVFTEEVGRDAKDAGLVFLGRAAAFGEQGLVLEDAVEVGVEGADRGREGEARRLAHVGRDLDGLAGVAGGEGLGELEDAEFAAHADVLLDVFHADAGGAFGEVLKEFVGLDDEFAEVGAGRFGEQLGRRGVDLEAAALVVSGDPVDDLVIAHGRRIDDDADFLDRLVEGFALVDGGAVQQDDENGGVQGLGAVEGELLDVFHQLRFLDDDQLPLRHHGEAPGRGDDHLRIHVGSVADRLVEVLLPFLQAVVDDRLADLVRIIRLLPHQQVHRLEVFLPDVIDEFPRLSFYVDTAFRHV